jgi:predicted transcriptional regulator
MKVGELCIREVVMAEREETVREAAARLRDMHVGCLVVSEERADGRYPIGIVTDRDLVIAVAAAEVGHARALRVDDVMTRDLIVARTDEDVHDAVSRMREHGVRRLPIIDRQGRLEGILAFDDLVEWMAEQLGDLAKLIAREQRQERARGG